MNVELGDVFIIEHPYSQNKIAGYITTRTKSNEWIFRSFNMDREYNFDMKLFVLNKIGRILTTPEQDFPEYYI